MKRFSTPSTPRQGPLRTARLHLLSSILPLALMLVLALGGCVLPGTYHQVESERDALLVTKRDLEEQVRLLRIANKSLDDHVAKLVDERESLLNKREQLEASLKSTREKQASLATTLHSREEELKVTAAALVEQSNRVSEMQSTYDGLVGDLEAEVSKGEIRIEQLKEGLQVDVSQDILFPSGSATLNADGRKVLKTVAARLEKLSYAIAVEGHTDDLPIRGPLKQRYPSNWELAGARAASVVRLFVDQGLDGSRLTAVSHGSTRPIASNDTPEGRAQNRRIEIRLRPVGDEGGPATGAGSPKGAATAPRSATPAAKPAASPKQGR